MFAGMASVQLYAAPWRCGRQGLTARHIAQAVHVSLALTLYGEPERQFAFIHPQKQAACIDFQTHSFPWHSLILPPSDPPLLAVCRQPHPLLSKSTLLIYITQAGQSSGEETAAHTGTGLCSRLRISLAVRGESHVTSRQRIKGDCQLSTSFAAITDFK